MSLRTTIAPNSENQLELRQSVRIDLSIRDLASLNISVPHWSEIAVDPANRGVVRHGVAQPIAYLPSEMKEPYALHAEPFLNRGAKNLLVWGIRNAVQNLFLPLFDRRRSPTLLCRVDEPWTTETYAGLLRGADGRLELNEIRFAQSHDANEIEIQTRSPLGLWTRRDDVEFAVTGQPLLWDGQLSTLESLAARSYDLRHVYRLNWESNRHAPRMADAHADLMQQLIERLETSVEDRAAAISNAAARHGLKEQDGYLHSSLGMRLNGDLILLAHHGSLREVSAVQKEAGATRAILLDNGGSVGYILFRESSPEPITLMSSSYFRSRGHATLVAELVDEFIEPPFRIE